MHRAMWSRNHNTHTSVCQWRLWCVYRVADRGSVVCDRRVCVVDRMDSIIDVLSDMWDWNSDDEERVCWMHWDL